MSRTNSEEPISDPTAEDYDFGITNSVDEFQASNPTDVMQIQPIVIVAHFGTFNNHEAILGPNENSFENPSSSGEGGSSFSGASMVANVSRTSSSNPVIFNHNDVGNVASSSYNEDMEVAHPLQSQSRVMLSQSHRSAPNIVQPTASVSRPSPRQRLSSCLHRSMNPSGSQNLLGQGNLAALTPEDVQRHNELGVNCIFSMAIENFPPPKIPAWSEKHLENRVNEILCCIVCLELPNTAIFQCRLGHIMCEPCLLRVFAESRLRNEISRCPACRTDMSFDSVSRNLAVEAICSEMPATCQYCNEKFPTKFLEYHMKNYCLSRPAACKYKLIGCPWVGYFGDLGNHEETCSFAELTGREIIDNIKDFHNEIDETQVTLRNLFGLLNTPQIVFTDIKLLLCIDANTGNSYFETSLFSSLNLNWIVRAVPDLTSEQPISFQLMLRSSIRRPLSIKFMAIKGPLPHLELLPAIYSHTFTNDTTDSPLNKLPINFNEGIRLLARAFSFNLRMLMFG